MFVKYFDSVSSLVAIFLFYFDILSPLFILISLYTFLYKGQVYDTVTVDNVASAVNSSVSVEPEPLPIDIASAELPAPAL